MKTFVARALLALLLLPLALLAPAGAQAQAPQPRLGLVLGNAEYRAGPLATAANDAGLIAETLRNAGFDVTGAANLDQDQTRRAFREFLDKAAAAGPQAVIFVYLSGRGLQFEGENYFVPVDATIARDSDVPAQAIRVSDLTRPLAGTPLAARIIVLDLARANNFAQGGQPLAPGLALVDPEDGSLIAFNAAPGTFGPDEPAPYGAYAQALSAIMREGGLPLDDVFARTRLRVNEVTRGAEVPWHVSKLGVPFVFFERAPGAPALAVTPQARAEITRRPIRDFPVEEAYGVAVERDTIAAYQEFLQVYPDSPLSPRVRALLAARREALIWRRAVLANRPEAYWTYIRRYPQGPHVADARRRLALISAPLEPPAQFAFFDYDVPPPPPEEVTIIDRRRAYFFDDPAYAPPPPAPVLLLGPRERERDYHFVPPPPPQQNRGFLPIPVGVPMPSAR
ncbi:MAG: caspase family protein, partial [Methylobacteriaceae bacterium]|nr:caspase family protein [Methylobacteriaceae bacterium]